MPTLTLAQEDALARRHVMRRIFAEVDAASGTGYYWDDLRPITVGGHTYQGIGTLGEVITVAANSDLSIQPLTIILSGINDEVANLIRGDVVGQEPIRLYIGIFDPDTQQIIGPLVKMFQGFVDDVQIVTPKTGEVSQITITCESVSRELTIQSTDTRSNESQKDRQGSDQFFKYTHAARLKPIYFGGRPKRGKNKEKWTSQVTNIFRQ